MWDRVSFWELHAPDVEMIFSVLLNALADRSGDDTALIRCRRLDLAPVCAPFTWAQPKYHADAMTRERVYSNVQRGLISVSIWLTCYMCYVLVINGRKSL